MTTKKTIAVVGATGAQGGALVRAIMADPEGPFTVRAITRKPDSPQAQALAAAGAQVVHEGGVAMRALGLGSFSAIWYRNLLRYVAKHGSLAARLSIRPLLVIGMILRALVSLLRGRRDEARAYLDVIGIAFGR